MKPSKLEIVTIEKEKAFLETPSLHIDNVKDEKIQQLALDMIESMKAAKGIGIAAVQVGHHLRLCIIGTEPEPTVMINPEITWKSKQTQTDFEGCLSIPKTFGKVERAKKIKAKYTTLEGTQEQITAKGMIARVILHEIDHLDGILFTSKAFDIYTEE